MHEEKLLASVVVFRELYDGGKDIYDIIAEFIKSAILFDKKWTFNVTEISQLLEKHFDFDIPDAVLKTTLRKRLKRDNFVEVNPNGIYVANAILTNESSELKSNFEKTKNIHSEIIDDLHSYIKNKSDIEISTESKKELADDLNAYLLGIGNTGKYYKYISTYIIENQRKEFFKKSLNAIKEGLILYSGIRYTSNLNEIGTWNNDITIYLDTEHLFNACGFNGDLYKEIFDDFHKLISEVNRNNISRNIKKKIYLKYFQESKDEVDNFFHVAELIIEGKAVLDPSKAAMLFILNGCESKSEIITKKAKFFTELKQIGIEIEEPRNYYSEVKHNIEDKNTLKELEERCIETGHRFKEKDCYHYLKLFTRINVMRKGSSNVGFEKIGYILMSGNSIAHFVANHSSVKGNERSIPFATDIDFITNRLWFKLSKGLGSNLKSPKSFDVVTKAKIAISSQIKNTVADKFAALNNEYREGKISKEQTIAINAELRSKSFKPEDVTPENIPDLLDFINEDSIEKYHRERSLLLKKVERGENAIQELQRQKSHFLSSEKLKIKKIIRICNIVFRLLFIGAIPLCIVGGIYILVRLRSNSDTILSIISAILTLLFGVISIIKIKWFLIKLSNYTKKIYLSKLRELRQRAVQIYSNQSWSGKFRQRQK